MVLCKHPKKNLIRLEKKITHQQMENKPKTIWDEIRVLLQASYKKSAKYTDQHKKKYSENVRSMCDSYATA